MPIFITFLFFSDHCAYICKFFFKNHRLLKSVDLDYNEIQTLDWKLEEPPSPGKPTKKKEDKDSNDDDSEPESKCDYTRFSMSGQSNSPLNMLTLPRYNLLN